MKIGFIGLGMMGIRMVKNLIKEFGEVNVWNRTKQKAKEILKMKGKWRKSPCEIAKNSDIVFLILKDKEAVNEVIFGENGLWHGLSEGKIVIDMTTNLPEYSIYLYNKLKEKGVYFLDAPVLGTLPHAEKRELIIIVGGDRNIFEKIKRYFYAMGRRVEYIGESGSASYLKLFINVLGAVSILALSEGLIYLERAGIDGDFALSILEELAFGSKAMVVKGRSILKNDFEPFFKLELMEKDIRYYVESVKRLGVTGFIPSLTSEIYRLAKNKGFGNLDFCAVYKIIEELNSRFLLLSEK